MRYNSQKIKKKYLFLLFFIFGIYQESISCESIFPESLFQKHSPQKTSKTKGSSPCCHKKMRFDENGKKNEGSDENKDPNIKHHLTKKYKRKTVSVSPTHFPNEGNKRGGLATIKLESVLSPSFLPAKESDLDASMSILSSFSLSPVSEGNSVDWSESVTPLDVAIMDTLSPLPLPAKEGDLEGPMPLSIASMGIPSSFSLSPVSDGNSVVLPESGTLLDTAIMDTLSPLPLPAKEGDLEGPMPLSIASKGILLSPSLPFIDDGNSVVWPENVTLLDVVTMSILQKGFYRDIVEMKTPPQKRRFREDGSRVDLKKITPERMNRYKALGGETQPLEEKFRSLYSNRPPIRNKELFPESARPESTQVFSPVACEVLSRQKIQKARQTGAIISLPLIAHEKPYIPETPEQRLLRKAQQKLDFEATEAMNGYSPQDLAQEVIEVANIFKSYFNYITYRKTQWKKGNGPKLRWYDKIDAFDKYVAIQPGVIRVECEGYEVFALSQSLDLKRKDSLGEANSEVMANGYCPTGADGKKMEYHHLTRIDAKSHPHYGSKDPEERNPFRIVLIPDSIHTSYSGIWHLSRKFYQDLPKKEILRREFGEARKKMNQAILAYMLGQ